MSELDERDAPTAAIAAYITQLEHDSVTAEVKHEIVRHHLDAVGCAVAAADEEPCAIARRIAATGAGERGVSSAIGLDLRTTPEYATFANAAMIRYLDFNDTIHSRSSGHLSELAAALWAIAEANRISGRELVLAMHAAYEVYAALAETTPMQLLGWDYGAFLAIATASGVARLLSLSALQTANAVALAITPSVPLGVARTGQLSHWKGCASAYSTMSGLFAARLASEGMTGPPRPFDGPRGLWARATPPFQLRNIGEPRDGRNAVQRTHIKLFPSCYETQAPVAAMIELHRQGVTPDDIEGIDIRTYELAWRIIGGGVGDHEQKWDPQTRETADHSLPYTLAVALSDGTLTVDSFSAERIGDTALRPLMRKISIAEDPQITRTWLADPAHEIEIRMCNGERRHIRASCARGHVANPMTDDELTEKFRANTVGVMDSAVSEVLLDMLWNLGGVDRVGDLMDLLRNVRTKAAV